MLNDIEQDAPSGPNLENDPDFGAMERAARGKPEQQIGDHIIPREEPDWKEVENLAVALCARTQDLRVLVRLALARLHLAGLPAFADTLASIREALAERWPTVHPQLDPEDGNDPMLRANALLALASPVNVLATLRNLPLAASARAGRVSWRDIALATGIIEAGPDQEKPTEAVIRAAFQEADPDKLAALADAVRAAQADTDGLLEAFDAHGGAGSSPQLEDLIKQLREIGRAIERYAPIRQPEPEPGAGPASDAPATAHAVPGTEITAFSLAAIATRPEAMRLLDLVAAYYTRYEPSSPLPLLLDRARRLADMTFMDVLRDLAPGGLQQAQIVAGATED